MAMCCDNQSLKNILMKKSITQCPDCNSSNIICDKHSVGKMIWDYFHCGDCNAKWINQFEFSGQFMIIMPESKT
jgi:hypothetical protein